MPRIARDAHPYSGTAHREALRVSPALRHRAVSSILSRASSPHDVQLPCNSYCQCHPPHTDPPRP
eukprot:494775-Prorocentrum_minimum.AAC.2